MNDPDWNLLRVFLCVARTGSLSKAAQTLRSSQPTVGRQIKQLEDQLGIPLVIRSPRGVVLTEAGTSLATSAGPMEDAIHDAIRQLREQSDRVRGVVRISVAEPIAAYALPPALVALQQEHPGITVELDLSTTAADLLSGSADIAVRMFVPEQLDLIAVRIGSVPTGLFASAAYIDRHGAPTTDQELFGGAHILIGFDNDLWARNAYLTLDPRLNADAFRFRTDGLLMQLQAARAGIGIVPTQIPIAKTIHGLVQVLPTYPTPPLPVFLTMHRDVRDSAAVRAAFDALREGLAAYVADANASEA